VLPRTKVDAVVQGHRTLYYVDPSHRKKIWGGHETARFNDAKCQKKSKTRWVSPQSLIIPVAAMFYLTPPGLEVGFLTAVGLFQQYHAGP